MKRKSDQSTNLRKKLVTVKFQSSRRTYTACVLETHLKQLITFFKCSSIL